MCLGIQRESAELPICIESAIPWWINNAFSKTCMATGIFTPTLGKSTLEADIFQFGYACSPVVTEYRPIGNIFDSNAFHLKNFQVSGGDGPIFSRDPSWPWTFIDKAFSNIAKKRRGPKNQRKAICPLITPRIWPNLRKNASLAASFYLWESHAGQWMVLTRFEGWRGFKRYRLGMIGVLMSETQLSPCCRWFCKPLPSCSCAVTHFLLLRVPLPPADTTSEVKSLITSRHATTVILPLSFMIPVYCSFIIVHCTAHKSVWWHRNILRQLIS